MAARIVPPELLRGRELEEGLTLVQIPFSPFAIPTRFMLEAAGAPHAVRNLEAWDRRPVIELTGGAYYAVPVIVDATRSPAVVVYESRDDQIEVARSVDAKYQLGLFPQEFQGLLELVVGYRWFVNSGVRHAV